VVNDSLYLIASICVNPRLKSPHCHVVTRFMSPSQKPYLLQTCERPTLLQIYHIVQYSLET
jgi:hypothetical protein